jgi:hypothetical protein
MREPRTKAQRRVVEARAELERQLGRHPTVGEIAKLVSLTPQCVSSHMRNLGIQTRRAYRRERGELVGQLEAAARAERRAAREAERAENLATILAMARAGVPQHEIAARLGEHQSEVCIKMRRAGIRQFDRWTVEGLQRMVAMLAGGRAVPKVAAELGRTPLAIVLAWRRLCASTPGVYALAYAGLTADELALAGATLDRTKAGYGNRKPKRDVGRVCPEPSSTSSAASK